MYAGGDTLPCYQHIGVTQKEVNYTIFSLASGGLKVGTPRSGVDTNWEILNPPLLANAYSTPKIFNQAISQKTGSGFGDFPHPN